MTETGESVRDTLARCGLTEDQMEALMGLSLQMEMSKMEEMEDELED